MALYDVSSMRYFKEKSIRIFESYITRGDDKGPNVCGILSRDCYLHWLSSRTHKPKNPQEAFRKALTSHCAGVDGRKPFDPQVEALLLKELRRKKIWDCFQGTSCKVGLRGFQVKGYWEKQSATDDHPSEESAKKLVVTRMKREREDETKDWPLKSEYLTPIQPFKQLKIEFEKGEEEMLYALVGTPMHETHYGYDDTYFFDPLDQLLSDFMC